MTARHRAGLSLVALTLAAAAALSACSSSAPTAGGDHAGPTRSADSATASAAGSVGPTPSASPGASTAGPASPSASTRPVNPPPSGHPNCLTSTVQVGYPGGDNPLRSVCVHVGSRIEITLHGAQGYPWRPVVSSSSEIVGLTTDTVTAGTVDATAQALAPGTAVLSATTRAAADPSGPMTKRWQLTVTVVP